MTQTGRHFLQIPGPTNVPDRVLRAMSAPTIDHRGPEFAQLGTASPRRAGAGVRHHAARRDLPGLRHRRLGGRAGQHVEPGRPRCSASRPATSRRCGRRWRARSGWTSTSCPATGGTASTRRRSPTQLAADTAHAIKAVLVVHNETSTGVTSRIAEIRAAIDAAGHPALLLVDTISSLGSIDYRHDEWGVDVTVAGSQKGLMLPPGLSFNAISDKALAASRPPGCRGRSGTGSRSSRPTSAASSPTPRPPTCSTACAKRCACSTRRACRTSSPGTSGTPRPPAPRCAAGAWRCCALTSASTPAR